MRESTSSQDADAQPKICNVCHLEYSGEECPYCQAEREQTLLVVQERGRRHHDRDLDDDYSESELGPGE
jgi:recombinational DNA repair protein RecR